MATGIHKLTKKQISSLKKEGRYNDGGGLYLHVRKSGSRSWIYRYKNNGRLREIGLGSLTAQNDLIHARKKASDYKVSHVEGKDPLLEKHKKEEAKDRQLQFSLKFSDVLEEFFESKDKVGFLRLIEHGNDGIIASITMQKKLHAKHISEITTKDVFKILEPMWLTKTETASRTRLYVEAVLSWAKTMEYRKGENPAIWRGNLDQLLTSKERVRPVRHHPGMAWQDVPQFYQELQNLEMPAARLLEFIILTASRSGEARGGTWSEINLEEKVWNIPAARMKMKRPHLVPIQGRMLELLELAKVYKSNELVFPNLRSGKEFSYNAPMVVLKKLGIENLTVHGFRSSFKTWALENTDFQTQAIEFALAHETRNAVEAAYIRGNKMLEKRREVMLAWNDFVLNA